MYGSFGGLLGHSSPMRKRLITMLHISTNAAALRSHVTRRGIPFFSFVPGSLSLSPSLPPSVPLKWDTNVKSGLHTRNGDSDFFKFLADHEKDEADVSLMKTIDNREITPFLVPAGKLRTTTC